MKIRKTLIAAAIVAGAIGIPAGVAMAHDEPLAPEGTPAGFTCRSQHAWMHVAEGVAQRRPTRANLDMARAAVERYYVCIYPFVVGEG